MTTHYRCPECGDHEHLYRNADVRWNFAAQAWRLSTESSVSTHVECTNCDWTGHIEDCVYEEPAP